MSLSDKLILALEGLRLTGRHLWRRLLRRGPKRHEGSPGEICRQVVADCWNGRYLQAGIDHLDQFWIRDLAISLEGLIHLGFEEEARASLEWARPHWQRAGRVTTTIFLHRYPVDVYEYASDSLPFLLYSLDRLEMPQEPWLALLESELERYCGQVIDTEQGDIRTDRMFSATKDTMHFSGTCFTHCMAAWLAELLPGFPDLPNPLSSLGLGESLLEHYWTGSWFRNHRGGDLCSGDANFWPYWCGLVDDEAMLEASLAAVRERGLDRPFPLKYHAERMPSREVLVQRLFLPNYQGDSIWTFFSCQWIELVASLDPKAAREYLDAYCRMLERYGNWIEVLEPDGEAPLRGRFGYGSDWGMLWAASLPRVLERVARTDSPEAR